MAKLTKAQERELEFMYSAILRTFQHPYNKTAIKVYEKLVDMGLAKCERGMGIMTYTLTDAGLQLARELFGTPEPTPTDSPEADASEPAQEAQDTASGNLVTCYNVFGEPYTITVTEPTPEQIDRFNRAMGAINSTTNNRLNTEGYTDTFYNAMDSVGREAFLETLGYPATPEIVTIDSVQYERRANGTLAQLPAEYDPSFAPKQAAHEAYLDATYGKQTAIQWRTLDDIGYPEVRYWNQRTGWFESWLQRKPYNAVSSPATRQNSRQKANKVSLPNMQRKNAPKPVKRNNVIDYAAALKASYPPAGQRVQTQKAG